MGPYESERQAMEEPMPMEVRELHDRNLIKSGDPEHLVRNTVLRHMTDACAAAGVRLSTYELGILAWLVNWETSTCQVIIGFITRARDGAVAAQLEHWRTLLASQDVHVPVMMVTKKGPRLTHGVVYTSDGDKHTVTLPHADFAVIEAALHAQRQRQTEARLAAEAAEHSAADGLTSGT